MITPASLPPESISLLIPRLSDEFKAFYFYRDAANWCANVGYTKAAEYFAKESADELEHAKKIEAYLTDWNVTPTLPPIASPASIFAKLSDVIDAAYQIEYALYGAYVETSKAAFASDLCTFDFLTQFRNIQVESVAQYSDILNKLAGVNVESKFEMLTLEETLFA